MVLKKVFGDVVLVSSGVDSSRVVEMIFFRGDREIEYGCMVFFFEW